VSIQLHSITEVISQAQAVAQIQAAMQNEDAQAVQGAAARQLESRAAEFQVEQTEHIENPNIHRDESGGAAMAQEQGRSGQPREGDEQRGAEDTPEGRDVRRGNIIDIRI